MHTHTGTVNQLTALAAFALIGTTAGAADFFWTGAENFNVNTPGNYSLNGVEDGPITLPTEPPDADDSIIWAYDDNYMRNMFVGDEFKELGALQIIRNAFDLGSPFPFINNGGDNPVRESLVFHGLAIDHTQVTVDPVNGGRTVEVLRPAVENTIFNINLAVTIASGFESVTEGNPPTGLDVLVAGGGTKVINVTGGQLAIDGSIGEFGGVSASIEKLGFSTMKVTGDFGITGDVFLNQGQINLFKGFQSPGTLQISGPGPGTFKRFHLHDDQDYKFTGITINAGSEDLLAPEVVLAEGTYSYADLETLGVDEFFTQQIVADGDNEGNGTLTVGEFVVPELFGDYNDDGVVDAADYTTWRDNEDLPVTLPNDSTPGNVTAEDYTVWSNAYGSAAAATGAAVPEPTAVAMILTGLVTVLPRRRV